MSNTSLYMGWTHASAICAKILLVCPHGALDCTMPCTIFPIRENVSVGTEMHTIIPVHMHQSRWELILAIVCVDELAQLKEPLEHCRQLLFLCTGELLFLALPPALCG